MSYKKNFSNKNYNIDKSDINFKKLKILGLQFKLSYRYTINDLRLNHKEIKPIFYRTGTYYYKDNNNEISWREFFDEKEGYVAFEYSVSDFIYDLEIIDIENLPYKVYNLFCKLRKEKCLTKDQINKIRLYDSYLSGKYIRRDVIRNFISFKKNINKKKEK